MHCLPQLHYEHGEQDIVSVKTCSHMLSETFISSTSSLYASLVSEISPWSRTAKATRLHDHPSPAVPAAEILDMFASKSSARTLVVTLPVPNSMLQYLHFGDRPKYARPSC